MANESNDLNAGGSMIADPRITEPNKDQDFDTCFYCTKIATKKIVHIQSNENISLCDDHATSTWLVLEALGVQAHCEVLDL